MIALAPYTKSSYRCPLVACNWWPFYFQNFRRKKMLLKGPAACVKNARNFCWGLKPPRHPLSCGLCPQAPAWGFAPGTPFGVTPAPPFINTLSQDMRFKRKMQKSEKSGAAGRPAVSHSICHRLAAPPHPMFVFFACLRFSNKRREILQKCSKSKSMY